MRPRNIVVIVLVVLLIIMTLQLINPANTTMVFNTIPKNNVLFAALAAAFILGFVVGYPRRKNKFRHIDNDSDEYGDSDTLSEEDRRYIE